MEKQANKLNHKLVSIKTSYIYIFLLFGSIFFSNAQERKSFSRGTQYILGNVTVTGKVSFNQQTVITYDPGSPGAQAYVKVAKEFAQRHAGVN